MFVTGNSILSCCVEEKEHQRRPGDVEAKNIETGL